MLLQDAPILHETAAQTKLQKAGSPLFSVEWLKGLNGQS